MRAPAASDIAAGEVLLSVENVTLSFGGVVALREVSFDIRKGEIRAIIGPNGAGKTSMLNVINGFYQPQQGRITFKGETRTKMRPYDAAHGGIARTFQNVALFKGMSALDNILAGRTLKMKRGWFWQMLRVGPALAEEMEHRRRVEEIIDFLEIQAIRKVPVARLPYGLQKRVELGRALAMEPDLLLLDEPMAGMNLEEKEDMSRFIIDVNDHYGTTIALIEHDMGVVMDLSDRVVVLDHGVKIADALNACNRHFGAPSTSSQGASRLRCVSKHEGGIGAVPIPRDGCSAACSGRGRNQGRVKPCSARSSKL
jgi:branched-chain amino acid transport system ATP-binding protein